MLLICLLGFYSTLFSCNENQQATVLRLEALLPDGLDTLTEVVEDMSACYATACGEEAARLI